MNKRERAKLALENARRLAKGRKTKGLARGDDLGNSKADGIAYAKQLRAITKLMTNETKKELDALMSSDKAKDFFTATNPEDSDKSGGLGMQAELIMGSLALKYGNLFMNNARLLATTMVTKMSQRGEKKLTKSIDKMLGGNAIDVKKITPQLSNVIQSSIAENVQLIKSIPQEYFNYVEGSVYRSIAGGDSQGIGRLTKDLHQMLSKRDQQVMNRAKNIALDQTRKAYSSINAQRMKDAGMTKYEWVHSGGGQHPRDYHKNVLNGQVFDLDNPPVIDTKTGERGKPGDAINCHPGDTVLNSAKGVNKLYRRLYRGELLEIITDDGVILKATPNHPILTNTGWKAAKLIDEGDYLIHTISKGCTISKGYMKDAKTTFVDFFDAAAFFIPMMKAEGGLSAFKFHGDTSNEEVDIINIDSFLPNEFNAIDCEKLCEFILSNSNVYAKCSLPSIGAKAEAFMGVLKTTHSLVSSFASILSILKCDSASAQYARLRLASDLSSTFNESSSNELSTYIERFRYLLLSDSRDVQINNALCRHFLSYAANYSALGDGESLSAESLGEIAGVASHNSSNLLGGSISIKESKRVVKKIVSEFSGHVYNLETKSNWYEVEDIITHNCKCTMRPIYEFSE